MAKVKIRIETAVLEGQQIIVVDKKIAKAKKTTDYIEFENKLEGDPTAILTFYKLVEKDDTGKEIVGFCTESAGKKVLAVSGQGSGKQDCNPTQKVGFYAYSIQADDHDDLDPIIIIEPQ